VVACWSVLAVAHIYPACQPQLRSFNLLSEAL
jgi:hypothetical protein